MNLSIHQVQSRIKFLQEQVDSLEHYLPETYQYLMNEMGRVPSCGVKPEARLPWSESEQGGMTACHSRGTNAPRFSTLNPGE